MRNAKYMELANKVRSFDPAVDTILVSSEDPGVIAEVKALNEQHVLEGGAAWTILTNQGDLMQGSGSATYFVEKARQGTLSLSRQMVSAISTLHFQMRSKYLFVTFRASFHILMHALHIEDAVTFTAGRMRLDTDTTDVHIPYGTVGLSAINC